MSHFYRDLHDRELLQQGELLLREIQHRKLLEVQLIAENKEKQQMSDVVFPRRLKSVIVENGKLILSVEPSFFRPF